MRCEAGDCRRRAAGRCEECGMPLCEDHEDEMGCCYDPDADMSVHIPEAVEMEMATDVEDEYMAYEREDWS